MKKHKTGILVMAVAGLVLSATPAAAQLSRQEQALFTEARNGRVERAAALIEQGVNVNARDSRGQSALILAVDRRHPEVAELLLAHGAEVCATALHRSAVRSDPDLFAKVLSRAPNPAEIGNDAILHAAFLGRTENVALLLDAGVPVDSVHPTNGRTPIMQALDQARTDTVEILIARGANLNARDPGGRSVLSYARGSEEMTDRQRATMTARLQEAGARE